ncbi:beta-1,3-galactosyltransferase 2 [Hippocampus comes]|uniref:beta-1,3-galactosyltransferase 2 n=1 Tax=Hippocampus comes TaxID=109280 RepID=UPI00094EF54D|nr:PREDICTED: beta-1,3-galactosyltransferase 2-like [Hippocampus comes]XP_019734719.1 PREDICTED: beta-1,3-galactosyltransferase 2-like [Hippocampus comes]
MQLKRRHCWTQSAKQAFCLLLVALLIFLLRHIWPNITAGNSGPSKVEGLQTDKSIMNTSISIWTTLWTSFESGTALETPKLATTNQSEVGHLNDTEIQGLFPYIINEPVKCRQNLTAPFLVFIIATEALQVEARDAIRQTWGNEHLIRGVPVVRIFLLGKDEGEAVSRQQQMLQEESRKYHDIIQQDFLDSYNNLTLKTLMGLHWVARYCSRASYVMKTDSDMFINTENLIRKLLRPELKPKTNYFTGRVIRNNAPIRDRKSKWYVSEQEYPNVMYPTFCSGTGYVLSGDLALKIYTTSPSVRQLHLEDVHVALCVAKLGLEPIDPPSHFLFNHWRVPFKGCDYYRLLTSHGFQPWEIIQYWSMMLSDKTKCATSLNYSS